MGLPQISHQALINEASRHKTWKSLETRLMDLIVSGQVLEYKHLGDKIEVQLDGTNKPVHLYVNPAAVKAQAVALTPASGFNEALDAVKRDGGSTAVMTKAEKIDKVVSRDPENGPRITQEPTKAPVGVVALIGRQTESYEAHARKLVVHTIRAVSPLLVSTESVVDAILDSWFRDSK